MKHYDLYLKRPITRGKLTIYLLPMRESLYAVCRIAAGLSHPVSTLGKFASAAGRINVGITTVETVERCLQRADPAIGIGASAAGAARSFLAAGSGLGMSVTKGETGKTVFAAAELSVGADCAAPESESVKNGACADFGVTVSSGNAKSRKLGGLSFAGGVRIAGETDCAGSYEAVALHVKNVQGVSINAEGSPYLRKLRLLSQLDPDTLGSWDEKSLEEVTYIEEENGTA